ncbi:MAG: ABC transporter ATP-binding protein [Gordonia sp. (in: high G+C Gram-positive bacteria)]
MITALMSLADEYGRRRLRRTVLLAVAAGVSHGLAVAMLVPVLQALFGSGDGLGRAVTVLIVACIVHVVALAAATLDAFSTSLGVIESMHTRLGRRLIALPVGWFNATSAGRASDLAVRGTVFVAITAMDVVVPVIISVTSPIVLVTVVTVIDWRIGLTLIAAAPVIWLVARWAARRDARAEAQISRAAAETDARILEFASHQAELRAAGIEGRDYRPLADAVAVRRRAGRAALWGSVAGMVAQSTAVQTAFGAVAAFVVWRITGTGQVVTGVAVLAVLTQIVGPLRVIASMSTALDTATDQIGRIGDLLAAPGLPEPDRPAGVPSTYDVQLDDVEFGYRPGTPVLRGLTATIPDRRLTAIVGPSGSGKTTCTRLIARLWDVDSGSVRIGGVDVRDLRVRDLYGSVSLIFQDVHLFDDTLEANVLIGDPGASRERVEEAARLARLTEVVERLPEGWSTRLGDDGSRLSGGERQRVSIARALLRRAPLVLCDEPTSAVDLPTNRAITDGLSALAEHATVVIVAHQLETIRNADHILVFDDGRVVEQGNHDELIDRDGVYRRLFADRAAAERWRPGTANAPLTSIPDIL